MVDAVTHGVTGTAMKSFSTLLSSQDIADVVTFVRQTMMEKQILNTRYHTVENGWENHQQYRDAFPFVFGEIPIDKDWEQLTESQQRGKDLYLKTCVICHDRSVVIEEGDIWGARPLSYPRNQYDHKNSQATDAVSSASPMAKHDEKPQIENLTEREKQGEIIFQENCAFCHASDGTGKNWIGRYIEPHPRNFLTSQSLLKLPHDELVSRIRDGVPGSAMPAWKTVLSDQQISSVVAYLKRVFLLPSNDLVE